MNLTELKNKNIKDLDFVAFDLETTGCYYVTSGIIEIGAVRFNLNGQTSYFQQLIDPGLPVNNTDIHGITGDMVKGMPFPQQVLPEFSKFIENAILIAHNATFDVSFISYNLLKNNLPIPENKVFDTKTLSRALISPEEIDNNRLSSLVDFFYLNSGVFHRALDDSKYCMEVFIKLLERISPDLDFNLEKVIDINKPLMFNLITNDDVNLNIPENLSHLQKAISDKEKIFINYKRCNGEVVGRFITPINFIKFKNKVYLEAFCHLRGEKRTFKLNKIQQT